MRSAIKARHEVEAVGRDAPGFFLYGLKDTEESIKNWKTLDEMADIVHRSFNASRYPDHEFYHIGVPDIDAEQGEVANVDRLPGKKIKGGKTIFRGGDIIFARIEPSIYNKKTAIVPNIGDCLGSTELLAARPKGDTNIYYLLWALRSEWIAQQILGKMTGSTGRRRFENTDFAKLLIPWVEPDVQDQIARVVLSARNKYLRLMRAARATLQEGEKFIVEMLEANENNIPSLVGYEYEEVVLENKWTNFEKLYVPNTGSSDVEQMEIWEGNNPENE